MVYGTWKDPPNLGWPATIELPAAAQLSALLGTLPYVLCLVVLVVVHALAPRDPTMPEALKTVFRRNE